MGAEIEMEADLTKEDRVIKVLKGLHVHSLEVRTVTVRNYLMPFVVNVAKIAKSHFVPVVRNRFTAELVSVVLLKFRQIGKTLETEEPNRLILLNRVWEIKV